MKKTAFFLITILAISCGAKKTTLPTMTAALMSECPKNGECTIQLLKNKGIMVKSDEFGRLYYNLEESMTKNVVKYTYNRKVKGDIQDASYREEIIFELDDSKENLNLSGESLQEVQLLFGRFCYCKGQTGYYKIKEGTLTVSKTSKENKVELNFKIKEVPQIINHLAFSIK
jgi:hypothetical protein